MLLCFANELRATDIPEMVLGERTYPRILTLPRILAPAMVTWL